jgi:integrase
MAGQHQTLDRTTIAKLKLDPGKTDQIFFDVDMRGFGYRLRNMEGKVRASWIAQYRVKGRTRRLKIGDAAKLTPDQARQAAKRVLAAVTLGRDPLSEKEDDRANTSRTLRAIATEYLQMKELQVQRDEYRASSYRVTKLYLTGKYFAPLHTMALTDITVADIASRLNVINRDSGTVTAGRARSALSSVFVWAMRQGYMGANPHNPVAVTENPDDAPSRDLVLSDVELAQVWREAGDDNFGRIIKLLILTGARREEIGGLCWTEIDRETGTITLPKERVKNRREHVLPITPLAAEILDAVPQVAERVFGVRSANGFNGWDAAKKALDKRLAGKLKGKSAGWRAHDLRRSLATWLGENGVEPWTIESLLNHWSGSRSGIAAIYNRAKHTLQVRAALSLWDDHLRSLIEGRKRVVLPLKRETRPTKTA